MGVTRIVLTGGPCAGKTTALSMLHARFSSMGYKVFVVPESATDVISGMGISPFTELPNWRFIFQSMVAKLQMSKEKIVDAAAQRYLEANPNGKVLILYDRGLLDQTAYISREEFCTVLAGLELSFDEAIFRYDAVIHLVTAAIGAEDAYTSVNNAARSETAEQAALLDNATMAAWVGHPHLRVIGNTTGFDEKIERVVREVAAVLGDPVPTEREFKFLVKRPALEKLEEVGAVKTSITQVYLHPEHNVSERRVRQRNVYGACSYYYTEKTATVDPAKRIEVERRISSSEFLRFLKEAIPSRGIIVKDRYCFVYNEQYFELDFFADGALRDENAILEIELTGDNSTVDIPDWIQVISDVTIDPAYKNAELARRNS